jgi:peptidoglycan hydrolase-like protein with peptidoglycan-binding domain
MNMKKHFAKVLSLIAVIAFTVQPIAPVFALGVDVNPPADTTPAPVVTAPPVVVTPPPTAPTTQVESNVTLTNSSVSAGTQTNITVPDTTTVTTPVPVVTPTPVTVPEIITTNPASTVTVNTPSIIPTDSTPPVITDIAVVSVLPNEATIIWTTDELSHSTLEYGTSLSYGQTVTLSATAGLAHLAALIGLSANTTYYYCVHSTDLFNNHSSSCGQQFITAQNPVTQTPSVTSSTNQTQTPSIPQTPTENILPIVTSISISNITHNSATISWQTDQPTTHQVEYGLNNNHGSVTVLDNSFDSNHSVTLTGLSADTEYHFSVKSQDGLGHETVSTDDTFVTASNIIINQNVNATPTISSVAENSLAMSSVTINWQTDLPATTKLDYGTDVNYGTTLDQGSTLSTNHSVTISGLTPYTNYHYRLTSASGAGMTATLNNQEFTTLSEPVIIDTAPEISNINASANTSGATVSWQTNEVANSQVEYGLSTSYTHSSVLNTSLATNHSASLVNLSPNTTYHYRVISQDTFGNTAYSNDQTITTSATPAENNANTNTNTTPTTDTTAPTAVANLSASPHTTQSINVSLGNVPSDAYRYDIRYSLHPITGDNFSSAIAVQSAPLYADEISNGSYTVAGLEPNTRYYFAVKISDSSDNWSMISNIADASTLAVRNTNANSNTSITNTNANNNSETNNQSNSQPNAGNTGSTGNSGGGGGSSANSLDNMPPSAISDIKAFGENGSISLFWKNPAKDFLRTVVVRNDSRYPNSASDGQVIYEGDGGNFTDTKLVNGKNYFYAIYSYDDAKNYSRPTKISTAPNGKNSEAKFNVVPELQPIVASFSLSKDLTIGAQNEDVRHIQQFLATDKFVYPTGEITGYFGAKTAKAVYEFQEKYHLKTTSIVDEATRNKIMALIKEPQVSTPAPFITLAIKSLLCQGARGEEVKTLQRFLSGIDHMSKNLVTGYFWTITNAAVKKFQAKYGEASENGCVGPGTLEQMNELVNGWGN